MNIYKTKSLLLMFISLFTLSGNLRSQEIIDYFHKNNRHFLNEKLDQLNALTKGTNKFFVEDGTLLMVDFLENGQVYRKDEFYIETINDQKVLFSEEEGAIVCACKPAEELTGKLKKFKAGCVQRHVIKNDVINSYFRINFKIVGDHEAFIKIIKELVISATTFHHHHSYKH